MRTLLLIGCLIVSGIHGCGQKGPLVLPEEKSNIEAPAERDSGSTQQ